MHDYVLVILEFKSAVYGSSSTNNFWALISIEGTELELKILALQHDVLYSVYKRRARQRMLLLVTIMT